MLVYETNLKQNVRDTFAITIHIPQKLRYCRFRYSLMTEQTLFQSTLKCMNMIKYEHGACEFLSVMRHGFVSIFKVCSQQKWQRQIHQILLQTETRFASFMRHTARSFLARGREEAQRQGSPWVSIQENKWRSLLSYKHPKPGNNRRQHTDSQRNFQSRPCPAVNKRITKTMTWQLSCLFCYNKWHWKKISKECKNKHIGCSLYEGQ